MFSEPLADINDNELFSEFIEHTKDSKSRQLGKVLLSPNNQCKLCGASLLVKADRPSHVTLYTDTHGTLPGTHFRKICKNFRKGCGFVQHYGHFSTGGNEIIFDDWMSLDYFISTRETGFEMEMLKQFDGEILLAQVSYKQRCDIYNYKHGYDSVLRKSKKMDKEFGYVNFIRWCMCF